MKVSGIKSYKQHKIGHDYDAIIIGSGISSMTCAAILAKEGQQVLVLERHYTAGGYTHVFKRNGYEWDVGIHYIGGVNHHKTLMYALFHYISGGQMQWEDMGEVYDKVRFGDELFEFRKGPKNFLKQLQEYFPDPADQRAIEQYLELVQEANAASTNYFAEKALPPLVAKVAGGQMRKGFLRFAEQTTLEVLEELTTNKKLIAVLTAQFGDYGLPPGQSSFAMHAMVVNHYLHGAAFPAGGSSTIAETISEVIAAAGGLILTNAEVSELIVENKRAAGVKMADGQTLRAPLIISGVGVRNSYLHLMPEPWRTEYDLAHQAQQVQPSAAHMCLYLGFKETAAELGLQKANYWIYPDGQYDHDLNVERFVEDATAEFPVVYISFPSAKDPHWEERYPGRATVDIITLAPYDWFEKWEGTSWKRRGADYEAFKEGLKERLLEVLYRYEPQLRGKVDHAELSTPLSTKDFVNYQHGEIYGINHDPGRFGQTFLRPQTPLKNFYLTGQDIVTAGIGGALMSGVLTISAIKKRDYVSKIYKSVQKELA